MIDFIQVVTTVPHKEDGLRLGRLLVQQHLVACVQIDGPIVSVYRWQGEIEEASEYRVTFKSRCSLFAKLEALVAEHHPYEVPELIATPVVHCSHHYQQWLDGELQNG